MRAAKERFLGSLDSMMDFSEDGSGALRLKIMGRGSGMIADPNERNYYRKVLKQENIIRMAINEYICMKRILFACSHKVSIMLSVR